MEHQTSCWIKLLAESTSFSSDLTQVSPSTAKSSSLSLYTTGITEPTFKVGSTIAGLAEERSSTATIRQHRSNPFCYNTKEISNKRTQTWRTIASIKTIDSFWKKNETWHPKWLNLPSCDETRLPHAALKSSTHVL